MLYLFVSKEHIYVDVIVFCILFIFIYSLPDPPSEWYFFKKWQNGDKK